MTNEMGRESVPEPPNLLGFTRSATRAAPRPACARRALPVPNMERLRPSAEG